VFNDTTEIASFRVSEEALRTEMARACERVSVRACINISRLLIQSLDLKPPSIK